MVQNEKEQGTHYDQENSPAEVTRKVLPTQQSEPSPFT